jgi:hypothetical protein
MNLFEISTGHVYATEQDETTVNAWGQHLVTGTLFDTVEGTVQAGAIATCNLPVSVAELVAGVAAERLGGQVRGQLNLPAELMPIPAGQLFA